MKKFIGLKRIVAVMLAIVLVASIFSVVCVNAADTDSTETGVNAQIIESGASAEKMLLGASSTKKYNVYGNHNYDVYWNKKLTYTNAVTGDKETFYANQYLNFHQVAEVGKSNKTTTWCIEPYQNIKDDGNYGVCGSGGNSDYWNKFKDKSNIYNATCRTVAYARAHNATSNGAYYFATQLLIYEYVMNVRYASLGNNYKLKPDKSSLISHIKSKNKDKIKDAYDDLLDTLRKEKDMPSVLYGSVSAAKKVIKKTAIFLEDKKSGNYTFSATKSLSGLKDYSLSYKIVNQNDGGAVDSSNMTYSRDGNKITIKSNYDLKKREASGYTYYLKVTKNLNYSSATSSVAYQNSNKNSQTLLGDVKYSEEVVGYYPIYYRYEEKKGDITVKKTVQKSANSPEAYSGSLAGWTFLLTNKSKPSEQYLLVTDSSGECDTLEDFDLNTTFYVTELGFKIKSDDDLSDYHYVKKYDGTNYGFPLEWESKTGSNGNYGFFETTATITSTTTVKTVTWKNEYTKPFELSVVKNVDDETPTQGYYFLVYSYNIFGDDHFAQIIGPTDANGKITENLSGYAPKKNDIYCVKELGLVKSGVTAASIKSVSDFFKNKTNVNDTTDIRDNQSKLDAVFAIPDRYDENYGMPALSGVHGAYYHDIKQAEVEKYYSEYEIDNTTSGYISVNKHDSHNNKPVKDAVYGVYSMNAQSSELVFDESTEVCQITTDENGYGISRKLSTGNYYVKEISVSPTYYVDETPYQVTVKPDTNTAVHPNVYNLDLKDQPTEIEINKKKVSSTDTTGKQLAGAELEIYEYNDNVEGDKIYSFISSDTPERIYGLLEVGKTYLLHEKAAPIGYTIASDVIFKVKETKGKTVVNMEDKTTVLKFLKKDTSNNGIVAGAELQLRDKDGNIVEVPVNGKMVKSWITTAEPLAVEGILPAGETFTLYEIKAPKGFATAEPVTFTVRNDGQIEQVEMFDAPLVVSVTKTDITGKKEVKGAHLKITGPDNEVIASWISDGTAHEVKYGFIAGKEYTLSEEIPGKGYVTAEDVVFKVKDTGEIQKVTMKDDVTKISFAKVDKKTKKYTPGAVLQLTDKENKVVKVPDKDGNMVESWTTTDKAFTVEGILVVGEKYTLSEIEPPEGYCTAEPVSFTVKDTPDVQTVTMEDDTTKFDFYKTDITGAKEVIGAHIQIFKLKDGKPDIKVDEWTSTKEPHRIEGKLIVGASYLMRESIPADGYVTAKDITFKVSDTGEIQSVTMKDDTTKLEFYKTDITGEKEVIGAHLQVMNYADNKVGSVVEQWISAKEPHKIEGKLIVGKQYLLRETIPADGYVTAKDVVFKVEDTGEIQKNTMKDDITKVEFYKTDITGEKEVIGAHLKLLYIDGEKETVIDEWVSSDEPHRIDGTLIAGRNYTLRETLPANGYATATDVIFKVEDTGDIQQVTMKDDTIKVSFKKTDITGEKEVIGAHLEILSVNEDGSFEDVIEEWVSEKEPHLIECKLIANHKYVLRETLPADGYATANDVEFTVSDTGEIQMVTMKDETITFDFSKTDITGKKEIAGAHLQVMKVLEDGKVGDVVESWVSTEETHRIDGKLIAGGKYLLRETLPADGYATANDIEFSVSDTGDVQKVNMKDDTIKFKVTKYDITGKNELEGAKMQILSEDGKIVDTWTSTKEAHYIEGVLVAGKSYILHEQAAPMGYVIANDVKFTVTDTGKIQSVSMKDDTTKVWFYKKAKDTNELLSGAKLKLYDSAGNAVASWTSSEQPYKLEGVLKSGETYTWEEVSAPRSYAKAEKVTFTVANSGKPQKFSMFDAKIVTPDLPKTGGVSANPAVLIALGVTMMLAGVFIFFRLRTRRE